MSTEEFIDQSLAKGIRRSITRRHREFLAAGVKDHLDYNRSWTRFSTQVIERYRQMLGNDNVLIVRNTSSRAQLFCVVDDDGGVGLAMQFELRRRGTRRDIEKKCEMYVPIAITSHFRERLIQVPKQLNPGIAVLLHALYKAVQRHFVSAVDGGGDVYPDWLVNTGRFAFAYSGLLIFGDFHQNTDLVCRTVIRHDRLERHNEAIWNRATASPGHFAVYE
jgi:hypothetical protein